MREEIIKRIEKEKIIAIVRGAELSQIIRLTKALKDGGITLVEIAFDQIDPHKNISAASAISDIKNEFGNEIFAGAGTVMTADQLNLADDAGAEFIISPDANERIIQKTRELGLVSIPGAMTPGECAAAHNAGADFVKLFPAGNLGPDYLRAVRAPLHHIKFLAVGGVELDGIPEFINAGAVGFGLGGKLIDREWIKAEEFGKISELAKKYVNAVNTT